MPPNNQQNQQLEARVKQLEQQMNALKTANSIPLEVDRAFIERGYVKDVMMYRGQVTMSGGSIEIQIPNATSESLVFVTPVNAGGNFVLEAEMGPSSITPTAWSMYAYSSSGFVLFSYVVITLKNRPNLIDA